jgi:hypothetical protein
LTSRRVYEEEEEEDEGDDVEEGREPDAPAPVAGQVGQRRPGDVAQTAEFILILLKIPPYLYPGGIRYHDP